MRVHKKDAQSVKEILLNHGLIDFTRDPAREDDGVCFPVVGSEADIRRVVNAGYEVRRGACPATRRKQPGSLAEKLAGMLPPGLRDLVPRSFNIVGTIAILELPPELEPHEGTIARELLALHPSLTSIFSKESEREGEFRTSALRLISGDGNPVTIHVENDCRFKVDVSSTFFDPRLMEEHRRVTGKIALRAMSNALANHVFAMLDLFCGVGPFVIPALKVPRVKACAVDINPAAIEFLKENVILNRLQVERIDARAMDAREFIREGTSRDGAGPGFDAIIMNLPKNAHAFIGNASRLLSPDGTMFWYTVCKEIFKAKHVDAPDLASILDSIERGASTAAGNPVDTVCMAGLQEATSAGLHVESITRVKTYAPYKYIYCIELGKHVLSTR